MIQDSLSRLIEVLRTEEGLYVRLRDTLQREHALMASRDAKGLEEVARRKEELADEGRLVEETRLLITRELARELGMDTETPRLSALCETLGPRGEELRRIHTRLVVLVGVVRELMDANRALAGDALAQVRGTLQLLGALVPGEVLYDPAARSGGAPLAVGQLVRRTA